MQCEITINDILKIVTATLVLLGLIVSPVIYAYNNFATIRQLEGLDTEHKQQLSTVLVEIQELRKDIKEIYKQRRN